jgi:hypothetical protein
MVAPPSPLRYGQVGTAATTAIDAAFADAIKVSEESGERLYATFACFCWQRTVADADTARGACCSSRR